MSKAQRLSQVVGKGLLKAYGRTLALRGVDIVIPAGRMLIIEGANGSGKSTLLGILGTVIKPTSGKISYEPFGDDLMAVRAEIGWLSHETMAYPDLSGRKNVELSARLLGLDAISAWDRISARFEIGAFAERPVRTYSRGQRQRIALARALVHEPSLVLLDEPTTGLDKSGIAKLLDVIDQEAARGATVVIVSHEPEMFRERASDRIVLDRGRIVMRAQ